jgi:hypothetical protein
MMNIKLISGIFLVLIILISCENLESKHYQRAEEDFIKYTIPDLKENLGLYMTEALALKKEEEKRDAVIANKQWNLVDPKYSSKYSEDSPKWKFWEEVVKTPDKYVAKTQKGDIFLEYKISSYEGEILYYSAMVSLPCFKDKEFAFLRVFFIYSERGWKQVDYEFSWPTFLSK